MSEAIDLSTENFFNLVVNSLASKTPMSMIRYGDGESMMINDKREDAAFILRKVLGYVPNDNEIRVITDNMISAYKQCDVLGIPTERHLARADNWGKALDCFKLKVGEEILTSKRKTSIDTSYDFLSKGYFNELLAGLDTLNYISCRNLDDVFKERFFIKSVNSFIISPEPTYTSGYVGLKHFPDQFNQVQDWMNTVPVNGSLCLVGAGIPGKPYCNWFRDRGGIAIDAGSVFDAWAGRKTRGAGRGLDAVDETNKL